MRDPAAQVTEWQVQVVAAASLIGRGSFEDAADSLHEVAQALRAVGRSEAAAMVAATNPILAEALLAGDTAEDAEAEPPAGPVTTYEAMQAEAVRRDDPLARRGG